MKRSFATKNYKHNWRKFKRKNITNFLNLKTYEEQADQTDLSQRNKSNKCINLGLLKTWKIILSLS